MLELEQNCHFKIVEWAELSPADQQLLKRAQRARGSASAPVSHFAVGAALRVTRSLIFVGCNVEDITHTGTLHAETCAIGTMITTLGKTARCTTVAIVLGREEVEITCPPQRTGADITDPTQILFTACGHCRTMLAQYGTPNTRILALQPNGQVVIATVRDLYPAGFSL